MRDEIEIVSSILLKGFQKLQISGNSQFLLSSHENERAHEGLRGGGVSLSAAGKF